MLVRMKIVDKGRKNNKNRVSYSNDGYIACHRWEN